MKQIIITHSGLKTTLMSNHDTLVLSSSHACIRAKSAKKRSALEDAIGVRAAAASFFTALIAGDTVIPFSTFDYMADAYVRIT